MTMIYQYINPEYGLEALRKKRLKISLIDQLNDPFELYPFKTADRDFRATLRSLRAELAKNIGVLCYSRDWRSPVLWAHYAKNHEGLCLGFETTSELTIVRYIKKRLEKPLRMLTEADVKKLISTKFSHWAYEEEVRQFANLDDKEGSFYYKDFLPDLILKEVYVGVNSQISRNELDKAIGATALEIKRCKVRPSFTRFAMTEQQDGSFWE